MAPIVKNTREILFGPQGNKFRITLTDGDPDIVNIRVESYSSSLTLKMSRKEFLDGIVACWPESVAYQFKDTNAD